jgi:hypothetical protein
MAQPGQPPDDGDVRFGDDIDEVLSRANPNQERVGCPPRDTLIGLARRAQPLGDPAYEHLVKCSPCYREFRALQEEHAHRQVPPPLVASHRGWVTAAAVAVLAAGLGGAWFFMNRQAPPETPPVSPTRTAEVRTELDLRKFAVTRNDQASPEAPPVSLPIGVVDLTLLLPVGFEPGAYDIQVLDSDLKSRASARAVGEIRDFVTTVRATLDLRDVPGGAYQLAIRREGDDWRMFPANIR